MNCSIGPNPELGRRTWAVPATPFRRFPEGRIDARADCLSRGNAGADWIDRLSIGQRQAVFDSTAGRLYGTPSTSSAGTSNNVQISVTDGHAAASLPAFSITVANGATVGNATLSWQAPTVNADGTPMTDLTGYVIRYGSDPASMSLKVTLDNPGITTYVVENLPAGTWYFVLLSVNSAGIESHPTHAVSLKIG